MGGQHPADRRLERLHSQRRGRTQRPVQLPGQVAISTPKILLQNLHISEGRRPAAAARLSPKRGRKSRAFALSDALRRMLRTHRAPHFEILPRRLAAGAAGRKRESFSSAAAATRFSRPNACCARPWVQREKHGFSRLLQLAPGDSSRRRGKSRCPCMARRMRTSRSLSS